MKSNKLKVRASSFHKLMTGVPTNSQLEKWNYEILELRKEKETLINKNGNKVSWTKNKEKNLNKLIEKTTNLKLSETAKTYIKDCANYDFFGIKKEFSSKELEKGIICEQDSIDLLNLVEFQSYEKNKIRKDLGWLSGECDIDDDIIIDIKTAWSFDTFPMLKKDVDKYIKQGGHEWQLRSYMLLFGKEESKVACCLVDTPDDLLSDWDNEAIHKVSHIEPNKRVSYSGTFKRDLEIEKQMKAVYDSANKYYQSVINELKNK